MSTRPFVLRRLVVLEVHARNTLGPADHPRIDLLLNIVLELLFGQRHFERALVRDLERDLLSELACASFFSPSSSTSRACISTPAGISSSPDSHLRNC